MMNLLYPPFTYFGAKTRMAPEIWRRFGDVDHFIDPFCGSLSVLLNRPSNHRGRYETVGDLDEFITHFWRAIKYKASETAEHYFGPVAERELRVRHEWLRDQVAQVRLGLNDPNWCDPKLAGWWAWGQQLSFDKWNIRRQRLSGKAAFMRKAWNGARRFPKSDLLVYFKEIQDRLRNVQIVNGDWLKVLKLASFDDKARKWGILLDPPYSDAADRKAHLYAHDSLAVAKYVCRYAIAKGRDLNFRIALCGKEGEHSVPDDWATLFWQSSGFTAGKKRECIWFSPGCLPTPIVTTGHIIQPPQQPSDGGFQLGFSLLNSFGQ